ncbi:MAG: hypothetical protein CMN57_02355 [Gammaproteobacteria bacterium]|nr:hypothetical protein [Gammaproteobacteria bacterium]
MAGTIFRASVIAVIVALVVPITIVLATGESVHYKTPMIPSEFYALSYEERQAWRQENEIRYSGFAYLKEIFSEPYHYWQLMWGIAIAFVVVFLSCLAMAKWESNDKGV